MTTGDIVLPDVPEELRARLAGGEAVAWREPVRIRTYEPHQPERHPMYFERRVYQGSSGRIYPLPFTDAIATEPTDRMWDAVHLENSWLRVMVLPELGGRIHIGFDKVAGYDFFYRNNVIKPALVGLAGPWISGGVEFNWPQHHRPATFLPVDTHIECADDGSATVWCSDHEPFERMKGMHGVRLHADSTLLEVLGRVHNRTSLRQTFLWWANAAALAHDDYQSFFPTDVRHVADHARRAITAFPAADRHYYGVDYPARSADGGNRIDFYRNIPVPTSYMVTGTQDGFLGGYDHAARSGFVHVADPHIAPGKKQWTWGNSPFGWAWDRLLTDNDGPYVELMAGVYTDNQPDFAWLEPGETKTFSQAWYPYQGLGVIHQANRHAAVHLDVSPDGRVDVGLCVTSPRPGARVRLSASGFELLDVTVDLAPGDPWVESVTADLRAFDGGGGAERLDPTTVVVELLDGDRVILRWQPRPVGESEEPEPATAPPLPEDIASVDELHLTGIHLAQYRHPTRSPLPYWEEGIARDPGHVGCHLALADDALRRGLYAVCDSHARAALGRLTARNANPMSGEASYLLGLACLHTDRHSEAWAHLAKAAWNRSLVGPASVELARLAATGGDHDEAFARTETALVADPSDSRARGLMVLQLRRRGEAERADTILRAWLDEDPLDQTARALSGLELTDDPRTVVDVALDLAAAGAEREALALLERAAGMAPTPAGEIRPMVHYHRAHLLDRLGRYVDALAARAAAREAPFERCFPSGLADHDALLAALAADPGDGRARDLLAMLLLSWQRPAEALELWEGAPDELGPVALRTWGVTAYNHLGDAETAWSLFERALALAPDDARLLLEADALRQRMGEDSRTRLERLDAHRELVDRRDDLTVTCADLLVDVGRAAEAHALLAGRQLAPWEGGEGRALAAWERACAALAEKAVAGGDPGVALELVDSAIEPPKSLGEARDPLEHPVALLEVRNTCLRALGRPEDPIIINNVTGSGARDTAQKNGVADEIDYFATSNPDLMIFTRRD